VEFRFESQGRQYRVELADGEHLLGRAPGLALQVPVPQVSSRHAQLRVDGGRLFIRDLGSTNGTSIAGRPLSSADGEVELLSGRPFDVAGVAINWTTGVATPDPPTMLGDSEALTHLSYSLAEGYRQSARIRITEVLSELFELIATEEGPEQLAERTCEFVSRCLPADSVVLLEDSGEGTSLEPLGSWDASGGESSAPRLSRAVVTRVTEGRTSLLLADLGVESSLTSDSIVAMDIRSVIAVPLFDNERVRGILYVDSQHSPASYTEDDLQLITATANAVAVKLRNLSMERELGTAARIQKSLLPRAIPEIAGFDLSTRLHMCRAVGGDLYHVIPRDNGKVMLALGDVSGKGMPAALAMSGCMVLLSTLAEGPESLCEIMSRIHRQLFKLFTPEQFITLFLAELDPATGELDYVNAGHEPPVLIDAEGKRSYLPSGTLPVAMLPGFDCQASRTTLEPGSLLAVFSDGIPEATLDGANFLGQEPLEKLLVEQRSEPLVELADAVDDMLKTFFRGGHASDDISLLLLRRQDP
jgi:phosphoserine phosphatase RsbU/P